jgi:hypothetical protein
MRGAQASTDVDKGKAHRLKPVPQGAAAELGEGGQALRYRKARRRMRGAQASTDVDKGKAHRLKPVPQVRPQNLAEAAKLCATRKAAATTKRQPQQNDGDGKAASSHRTPNGRRAQPFILQGKQAAPYEDKSPTLEMRAWGTRKDVYCRRTWQRRPSSALPEKSACLRRVSCRRKL